MRREEVIFNQILIKACLGRKKASEAEGGKKAPNVGLPEGGGISNLKKKKKIMNLRADNAFSIYLLRILKTTKPEIGISKKAMA
jgi:hypothetical protein